MPETGNVKATPGSGGTIGYLAPEQEMDYYNTSADSWSLVMFIFQLFYSYHPLEEPKNPWRYGYESLRTNVYSDKAKIVRKIKSSMLNYSKASEANEDRI